MYECDGNGYQIGLESQKNAESRDMERKREREICHGREICHVQSHFSGLDEFRHAA